MEFQEGGADPIRQAVWLVMLLYGTAWVGAAFYFFWEYALPFLAIFLGVATLPPRRKYL